MYLYFRLGVYPYLMPALLPITVLYLYTVYTKCACISGYGYIPTWCLPNYPSLYLYIYKMYLYFRLWVYPYLMPALLPITSTLLTGKLCSVDHRTTLYPVVGPNLKYGSGSTKLVNTASIWIWIHNTGIFASLDTPRVRIFSPYFPSGISVKYDEKYGLRLTWTGRKIQPQINMNRTKSTGSD